METRQIVIAIIISVLMTLSSCVTNKKLTYLQYSGIAEDTAITVPQSSSYKIQPFDNLFIRVVTPDPKWADMFNAMPVTSSSNNINEQSAELISYSVDADGTMELPYIGRFEVSGKTIRMIKTELENALKAFVADAAVIVKIINNYVSILGEVKNPGRYPIYKDRMNIFQALAMAGDLGDFSDRTSLQIIRQTHDGNLVREFSLNDRKILTSDFFYVMPNDVIYAKPIKGRFFQINAFPYSVIISSVTTFILILSFIHQ
jgi:polysaccharide biosynthesis/export protein